MQGFLSTGIYFLSNEQKHRTDMLQLVQHLARLAIQEGSKLGPTIENDKKLITTEP